MLDCKINHDGSKQKSLSDGKAVVRRYKILDTTPFRNSLRKAPFPKPLMPCPYLMAHQSNSEYTAQAVKRKISRRKGVTEDESPNITARRRQTAGTCKRSYAERTISQKRIIFTIINIKGGAVWQTLFQAAA
ncbi:MAG: hypothetical protein HY22_08975 [[Candidatus Thermochlorobacteriaceae] bacterium GBChlB]|nr:MAG: hypothetical protein HY22_08975 [[Candidatus Thermochlorobacteriaceae] bacterium GBChlB]